MNMLCACSFVHPACDQANFYFNRADNSLNEAHVSLDQRSEPTTVDSLIYEIAEQFKVPEVSVVARDQIQRVVGLFLHPRETPLPGRCQVVPVCKVEAIVERGRHHCEQGGDTGC